MGSLRNPIGPLPASIYWRRRVLMLSGVALLALLIVWITTSGGGGGHRNDGGGSDGKNPSPSTITPGPSESGPAISQRPGGRDESGGGDSTGSGSGTGSGSASGGSGADGSGGGSASAGGDTGGAGSGGANGAGGTGAVLPAGSSLPDCSAGAVQLSLRSVRNSYGPGETPTFELVAKSTAGNDCKVDLGPKSAVLTVTPANSSDDYWSSADCPKTAGSLLFRVPAKGAITHSVRWDRKPSAAQCATPPAGTAAPGTYLVQAKVPGHGKLQTSFVLSAD